MYQGFWITVYIVILKQKAQLTVKAVKTIQTTSSI
jgi:hypothetical protein